MSDEMIVLFSNAKNRLQAIARTNEVFLGHVSQHGTSAKIGNTLVVIDGVLSVNIYGYTLTATPRTVRAGSGYFAMEYTFIYAHGDAATSIWRFYLTENGRIVSSLSSETARICDYDNTYLGDRLLVPLYLALLESTLFASSEPIAKNDH